MNKLIILLKNILNHPEFIENNILLNVALKNVAYVNLANISQLAPQWLR